MAQPDSVPALDRFSFLSLVVPGPGMSAVIRLDEGAAYSATGTEDLLAGRTAIKTRGEGTCTAKAVADTNGEFADHVEVFVARENRAPVQTRTEDSFDGLVELKRQVSNSVEAENDIRGGSESRSLAPAESGDPAT
jgi:hypothetical protein